MSKNNHKSKTKKKPIPQTKLIQIIIGSSAVIFLATAALGYQLYRENEKINEQVATQISSTLQSYKKRLSAAPLSLSQRQYYENLASLILDESDKGNNTRAVYILESIAPRLNKDIETSIINKQIVVQKLQAQAEAEQAKIKAEAEAAAKLKAEADAAYRAKIAASKPKITPAPSYQPQATTGSCSKNEYYVVVNVNTNIENVYMGDPDCRTGNILETRSVATGMHQNLWNPSGWWYWGATPTGKWKIISKEPSSGATGTWFLRLHYLAGGYVDQYALHGTNEPGTIGQWVSHGCIRHYNEDIVHLYNILPVGTTVWTI